MEQTALYRKWRPMTFAELVGHGQVTQTLRNQIKSRHFGHAYMFSGIRGTGKTSVARLFARAVNCTQLTAEGDPCNVCESCLSILSDQCMDVIEMDAASNNGVDDIRDIRDHVKFPPSQVSYKVYIIDEVHMLSKGAFNALLKTLEEPPSHVLFLLATTELHKVPPTILSRCQRYDFRRIPQDLMLERLKLICDQEGYRADQEALEVIVRYSDGALRDAQSLLNQCMSFAPESLSVNEAIEALGKAKDQAFEQLLSALVTADTSLMLTTVQDLVEEGKDLTLFLEDLIERLRGAMLLRLQNHESALQGAVAEIPMPMLLEMMETLSKLGQDMKWSSAPRVLFEVAFIKWIRPEWAFTLTGLDKRISALEKGQPVKRPESVSASNLTPPQPTRKIQDAVQTQAPEVNAVHGVQATDTSDAVRSTPLNFSQVADRWNQLLEAVKQELKTTHALLMETTLLGLEGVDVYVAFPENLAILSSGLEKEENKRIIEAKLLQVYGQPLRIKVQAPVKVVEQKNKQDQVLEFFSGFEDKMTKR